MKYPDSSAPISTHQALAVLMQTVCYILDQVEIQDAVLEKSTVREGTLASMQALRPTGRFQPPHGDFNTLFDDAWQEVLTKVVLR